MNEFIVSATVTQEPQLRYTPDTQTAVTEMWVEFPGLRDDDPVSKLKVTGWGNLAQEMQQSYHRGDRVIVEGQLGMKLFERQEGFKEKQAELTARRIHRVNADATLTTVASTPAETVPKPAPAATSAKARVDAPTPPVQPAMGKSKGNSAPTGKAQQQGRASRPTAGVGAAPAADPIDYDEIPFVRPIQPISLMSDDPIDFVDSDLSRPVVGFEFGKF